VSQSPTDPTTQPDSQPDSQPTTDYDVVLLVEHALTDADARLVRSLHESLDEPVVYHLLMPLDDAAERIAASMGSVTGGEMLSSPAATPAMVEELDEIREQSERGSHDELTASVAALETAGATVAGSEVVDDSPIRALADKVHAVDGREAVVLTEPHTVAEFFHVDWASQARRELGIPVLHLLEHENLDEQAGGGGQGVSGF